MSCDPSASSCLFDVTNGTDMSLLGLWMTSLGYCRSSGEKYTDLMFENNGIAVTDSVDGILGTRSVNNAAKANTDTSQVSPVAT